MSDLIDRQEAIDALERHAYRYTYLEQIIDIVNALPSAESEIVRCNDCAYWDGMPSSTIAPEYHECVVHRISMRAEDFCSRARRRQE